MASEHHNILADCQAGEVGVKTARVGLVVGVAGIGAGVLLGYTGGHELQTHFWFAYLVAWFWLLTIGLGTMLFSVLAHLVGAHWSVTVRRLAEVTQSNLPLFCLLGLPLLYPLLSDDVTVWRWAHAGDAHHEAPAAGAADAHAAPDAHAPDAAAQQLGAKLAQEEHHHVASHKVPYLNVNFLLVRFAIYGLAWWLLSRYYFRRSVAQDTADDFEPTRRMRKWSAPTVIVFALTISFAAFDLLMSLDEAWFSTMFGVIIFAGAFMSAFAWLIVASKYLQSKGRMTQVLNTEHYHDLGKMMFAFICFWAYTSFSQFMLIWYANLPEETRWFQNRLSPAWQEWSWALMFGHFMIPFVGLISRHVKRHKHALTFWAVYMLGMHWVDIYWIAMPNLEPSRTAEDNPFHVLDVALLVGMAGILVWATARRAAGQSLVPLRDPLLDKCLAHKNV